MFIEASVKHSTNAFHFSALEATLSPERNSGSSTAGNIVANPSLSEAIFSLSVFVVVGAAPSILHNLVAYAAKACTRWHEKIRSFSSQ